MRGYLDRFPRPRVIDVVTGVNSLSRKIGRAARVLTGIYGRALQKGRGPILRHVLMTRPFRRIRPDRWRFEVAPGYVMELELDRYIDNHLFWFGRFEDEVGSFLIKTLRAGDFCIDVGAHMGYFSMVMASLVVPDGKVLAFEPEPRNFARLACNTSHHSNVKAVNAALSSRNGKAPLWLSAGPNDAMHSLFKSPAVSGSESIEVQTLRLDTYFKNQNLEKHIRLIKLDCEGSEIPALEGMRETIAQSSPTLVVEMYPPYLKMQGGVEKFKRHLFSLGYVGFKLHRDGSIESTSVESNEYTHNMVFLREVNA